MAQESSLSRRSDGVALAATAAATQRPFPRRLLSALHLYVGLVIGPVFALIGLTGSILVYHQDVDEWLNPDLMTLPTAATTPAPLDDIVNAAQQAAPAHSKPIFIHFPRQATRPFDVIFSAPGDGPGGETIHQIFVDHRNGAALGQRLLSGHASHGDEPFVMFVMHLHANLLLGEGGAVALGICAITLFAALGSGVYLWAPRNGAWRQAVSIKRGASAERLILDLHKTTGIYACALLAVSLFSGIYLIFPEAIRTGVSALSPTTAHAVPRGLTSEPAGERAPIGFAAAVAAADRLFPAGETMSMQPPQDASGYYLIGEHAPDEVYRSETRRLVAVDQYSGKILHVQDPREFTAGERFIEWLFPLHVGEAFGDIGRAIVFCLGAAPTALYVTGLVRWARKRRRRRLAGV
jgi:uncharacterized iron-regulated membrane protein